MPTYQYGIWVCFTGSLANVHWVENQINSLIEKARNRDLQADLEIHVGSKVSRKRGSTAEPGSTT